MMTMRVNGENLTNFQTARVERSMRTLCSRFNFMSTADNNDAFPVRRGDLVEILVEGFVILTGHVDRIQVSFNTTKHQIAVSGRDLTQDFVDSSVKDTKEFTGGTLQNIARIILDDLGLTNIKVINNAGTIEPFSNSEIQSAEPGENAFDFVEKYARKRQVLLTTDGLGNLIITRSTDEPSTTKLRHKRGRNDNNILKASFEEDESNLYCEYYVLSQENLTFSLASWGSQTVNQAGVAFDTDIRNTRYLELNAEDSLNSETAADRAAWESNFRRSNSNTYKPLVQGFLNNNMPWSPNTLVNIEDDFADISGDRLIEGVIYLYSITKGSLTELSTVPKDSYKLEATQNLRESQRTKSGEVFVI